MPFNSPLVVILGTGGTIAGTAASLTDDVGYTAAQRGVDDLVAAVPPLAAFRLATEQVAQVDSKDMDFVLWQRLAQRAAHHLQRDEVAGVVITHGTDTLEETAWFLHRVLAPAKPLVLTAAMRPATSLQADGPQNLLDAVTVATHAGAHGVLAVLAGAVHGAGDLRKGHTSRLDAFSSGDDGPIARIEHGALRVLRPWPVSGPAAALGLDAIVREPSAWPWVEIVSNHAGGDGRAVDALVAAGVRGLVVAGTGNGSVSQPLAAALRRAQSAGVPVVRASRCGAGAVVSADEAADADLPVSGSRSPAQARVDMIVHLLAGPA